MPLLWFKNQLLLYAMPTNNLLVLLHLFTIWTTRVSATSEESLSILASHVNKIEETSSGDDCRCDQKSLECSCTVNGISYKMSVPFAAIAMSELSIKDFEARTGRRYRQETRTDWPLAGQVYDMRAEHPLLGTLTGNEEPLRSLQMLPTEFKWIPNRFTLFDNEEYKILPKVLSYNKEEELKDIPIYQKLYIVIHGFTNFPEEEQWVRLKYYLLLRKGKHLEPSGVVMADWRYGADLQWKACNEETTVFCIYDGASVNTFVVGRQVGLLVHLLVEKGRVREENVHCIGFSLGAQVCHVAAVWFTKIYKDKNRGKFRKNKRKIGRISALDPAAKNFQPFAGAHVSRNDAHFVDIIHTSAVSFDGSVIDILASRLGMSLATGHVDFFPNGGQLQPGCEFKSIGCSHSMSVHLFTDSLKQNLPENFVSVPCRQYLRFEKDCLWMKTQGKIPLLSSLGIHAIDFCGRGIHMLALSSLNASIPSGKSKAMISGDEGGHYSPRKGVNMARFSDKSRVKRPGHKVPGSRHTVTERVAAVRRDHPLCGLFKKVNSKERIIGGRNAYLGQFPWMARIFVEVEISEGGGSSDVPVCGASILNQRWLLTAAHCFDKIIMGSNMFVLVGLNDLNECLGTDRCAKDKKVAFKWTKEHVYIHEKYTPCNHYLHDIALIRLGDQQLLNLPQDSYNGEVVNRICLYPQPLFEYNPCDTVTVSGYGFAAKEEDMMSGVLHETSFDVQNLEECRGVDPVFRDISKDQFCVVSVIAPYPGLCRGDAGDPAVTLRKMPQEAKDAAPFRAYQVGVTSSSNRYFPCGVRLTEDGDVIPEVQLKVSKYLPWIESKLY